LHVEESGKVHPSLNKKANEYPKLSIFGNGLLQSEAKQKRYHTNKREIDVSDIAPKASRKHSSKLSSISHNQPETESKSFPKKIMRMLKDKYTKFRKRYIKEDLEEY